MKITKEYAEELIEKAYDNRLLKTDKNYIEQIIKGQEWI